MANRTPLTAENPITLEMLNSFVQGAQVVPQTNINEIELWTKSAIESELAKKADKSNFTKFIFNESVTTLKDGYTYYGSTIDNATVSSGTYYFYNCTGALTVSGNFATVYATNCPELSINGKNDDNWKNIWVDGVARDPWGNTQRWQDGLQIVRGVAGSYGSDNPFREKPINLPTEFINDGYDIVATARVSDNDYAVYQTIVSVCPISKTQFYINYSKATSGTVYRSSVCYIAIGRWK